jgi:hypothetical protein
MVPYNDRNNNKYAYYFSNNLFLKSEITKYFDGLKLWGGADKLNKTDNARMTLQRGACVQPLLRGKSNKYYILWVCVWSLRYPACNGHMPYYHLRPARLYHIFPPNFIKGTIFGKKVIKIKCHFLFCLQLCLKHFWMQKECSEVFSQMYKRLHIKYQLFLSDV